MAALARGEARVCVGPRSAVFAPLPDIGLIVVDEEHDGSYKHEGDPRYDARTVARAARAEHGARAAGRQRHPAAGERRDLHRLRLPRRVDGQTLPPVEILDMRGSHHPLHPETPAALADLRRAGGKAIVLLNRRGWSNFLSCRDCGHVWMCPNCDVALVLHRGGATSPATTAVIASGCPRAAGLRLGGGRPSRGGDRADRARAAEASAAPVSRLPARRRRRRRSGRRATVLERFAAAPAAMLVGTQMVAKGHDFPDVALGVVLDADATLRFPDFRAEERTFALIAQLAGRGRARATRGGTGARPDARPRRPLDRLRRPPRLRRLPRRRARPAPSLGYPPFASLIRVVCSRRRCGVAAGAAAALHARIALPRPSPRAGAAVPAARPRAAADLIKAADRAGAIAAVGAAVEGLADRASRRGVSISVDVDPSRRHAPRGSGRPGASVD